MFTHFFIARPIFAAVVSLVITIIGAIGYRGLAVNQLPEIAPPTIVVSNASAPAELQVPVVITFDLTTNCDMLMDFHRDFGTKYQGWLDDDGLVTTGWVNLLRYVIGQPAEQVLISVAQKYTWREIWNDEKVRIEFQNALRDALPGASKARTDGREFFTNFQVTVLNPDPVDEGLKEAIIAEQKAIADARAADVAKVARAYRGSVLTAWYLICLLYTSPSPRDRTRSRMPSSA